jgi:hypothetical protein
MELKKCPFRAESANMMCLGSECNLMANGECVFIGVAKNLQVMLQEVNLIKQRVYIL